MPAIAKDTAANQQAPNTRPALSPYSRLTAPAIKPPSHGTTTSRSVQTPQR